MLIPANNTYEFFASLTSDSYRRLGINNGELAAYSAGVLARFTLADEMFRPMRNIQDPFNSYYVSDLLEKAESLMAQGTEYGRHMAARVYRHLGDLALVLVGFFPEHLDRRGSGYKKFYLASGKMGYETVSDNVKRTTVPIGGSSELFSAMSESLGICTTALGVARRNLSFGNDELTAFSRRFLEGIRKDVA